MNELRENFRCCAERSVYRIRPSRPCVSVGSGCPNNAGKPCANGTQCDNDIEA
ncbi:hypothetical protein EDE08_102252 [Bradyrhizobium sp. R2.2-H]|jgi:hypothetical protein|nr:hypothetical protein EDE10_102252 [Bradyrhizobium sp. Y-H1]TCU79787.1 hypothetical protein EDE08_102252 [Bradyrhizobium sp. R2.2-H]